MTKPVKVLIVDDSALIRSILSELLKSDPRLEVVGSAEDPFVAREKIKKLKPDVLTLDVEMPRMDGLSFLKNLMRLHPLPVVMISTLTERGAPVTLQALELGAVDYMAKPKDGSIELQNYGSMIADKVYGAAKANVKALETNSRRASENCYGPPSKAFKGKKVKAGYVCAIGASTGGTEAIKEVLTQLPKNCPPILIAQHIPPVFSKSFAQRMDLCCDINVWEAEDGQPIQPGCAYIAPGDHHLLIKKKSAGEYVCQLSKADRVNRHRPSVDVMFDSVVSTMGHRCSIALLTGMGADGAKGLERLHDAGALTIAQDEATSVVWGMPGAAVKLGAASKVLPLPKISAALLGDAYQ